MMARKAQITQSPWDEARIALSLRFKDLSSAIKEYRERAEKKVHPHHFSNEIRLIKRLINGGNDRLSMDEMTLDQLISACDLMTRDTELLMSGIDYSQRKALLTDQIQT
jgi:KaiC/GvpD/RAD55 family RecA-like ATPase